MKRLAVFFLCLILFGCDKDELSFLENSHDTFLVEGNTYKLKNYSVESSINLNRDRLFGSDLTEEKQPDFSIKELFDDTIFFGCPTLSKQVFTMSDPQQNYICLDEVGAMLTYEQEGHTIRIGYNDQVYCTAELTEDNTMLIFVIPLEYLSEFDFFGDAYFVNNDEFNEKYTGSARFTYGLLE